MSFELQENDDSPFQRLQVTPGIALQRAGSINTLPTFSNLLLQLLARMSRTLRAIGDVTSGMFEL